MIPSKLGYKTKEQLPIPRDFGERQRLYSTVLNRYKACGQFEAYFKILYSMTLEIWRIDSIWTDQVLATSEIIEIPLLLLLVTTSPHCNPC